MEEDRERQIQELVAKHEEQVRQAYAFATQSTHRMGPQHIDRAQSESSEDDGELDNMKTISRASITDSLCRPGQYRREVPQMLSRSAVRLTDRQFAPRTLNYTVGDHPQDEFITIQASKKDKHTDRKEQEEKEEGDGLNYIDVEIREMERRLTQMRQQGFYPID